jgi:hypothetical protein
MAARKLLKINLLVMTAVLSCMVDGGTLQVGFVRP